MKLVLMMAATVWLAGLASAFAADNPPLKAGDKAPDFKLQGSDGKEYTLKQFAGKQAVVIAWFPKAFTGG